MREVYPYSAENAENPNGIGNALEQLDSERETRILNEQGLQEQLLNLDSDSIQDYLENFTDEQREEIGDDKEKCEDEEKDGKNKPGWIKYTVDLVDFSDKEGDKAVPEELNNFHLFFKSVRYPNIMVAPGYLNTPAFRRFAILFPETTRQLAEEIGVKEPENFENDDILQLKKAHRVMSKLVDKRDPEVVDKEGQVDQWVLTR